VIHEGFKIILTRYWNCRFHEHRYFFAVEWPGHKQISPDFCTAEQANKAALQFTDAQKASDPSTSAAISIPAGRSGPVSRGFGRSGNSVTLLILKEIFRALFPGKKTALKRPRASVRMLGRHTH